jgi:hypothetical protein
VSKLKTTYADIVPPLATTEFDSLKEGIKADGGILSPILVDDQDEIIDGKHRYLIDPNCPRKVIAGARAMSAAQKKAMAIRLNVARRNMTPEQKEELQATQKTVAGELAAEMNGKARSGARPKSGPCSAWPREPLPTGWTKREALAAPLTLPRDGPRARSSTRTTRRPSGTGPGQDETHEQIAADFGISRRRVSQVVRKVDQVKERDREQRRLEERGRELVKTSGVITGDFREAGQQVPDAVADLIFTDPPYHRKHLGLYDDLAARSNSLISSAR